MENIETRAEHDRPERRLLSLTRPRALRSRRPTHVQTGRQAESVVVGVNSEPSVGELGE